MTDSDIRAVEYLFDQLQSIFPKWRELYPDAKALGAAKASWSKTLVEQGITSGGLIELGLKQARAVGWARPPAPGQFCAWAWEGMQERQGIPNLERAEDMILRRVRYPNTQISGSMYHVLSELDWFQVKRSTDDQVRRMVKSAWNEMIRVWKSGGHFREPLDTPAVEDQSGKFFKATASDKQTGKAALAALLNNVQSARKVDIPKASGPLVFSASEKAALSNAFAESSRRTTRAVEESERKRQA